MKKAKFFNNIDYRVFKELEKVNSDTIDITIKYTPYSACFKLGIGEAYDDHCGFDFIVDEVKYNPSIIASNPTTFSLVSDIDLIHLSKNTFIIKVIDTPAEGIYEVDSTFLEKLFVKKLQILNDNGFVGWASAVPEFTNHPIDGATVFTKFLNKLWNIPDNLEWFNEGMYESGIELNTFLELGYLGAKFPFVDFEKEKQKDKEKCEAILKASKYEDWMFDFVEWTHNVPEEIKKKAYKLKYESEKDFFDESLKKHIEKIKAVPLYEVGKTDLPFPNYSWGYVVDFTPYKEEFDVIVGAYKAVYNDLIVVDSKAGSFIANKKDKVWNVKVPDNKKGLFIGKSGANIKELAERYGVRINVI